MARNLFREFTDLLPQRPLQVATVTATDGGTCTVELPGELLERGFDFNV